MLGVSIAKINYVCDCIKKQDTPGQDKRGKHQTRPNKISDERREGVLNFIDSIFVCRYVSQIYTMTVEISNDHIHMWGSGVAPEAELLIRWWVVNRHHRVVQLSMDYLNIVCD